jgi:hypothetical protein
MKPWMVMLMIEALGSQDAGLDPELGLDKHFYNLATDGRKQVIGLETAESQIDRFDKMPEAMQEQMLRSELAEMDTEKSSLRSILTRGRPVMRPIRSSAQLVYKQPGGVCVPHPPQRNWMPQLDACQTHPVPGHRRRRAPGRPRWPARRTAETRLPGRQ